ncbi:MAG: YggT family protein [Quisquiliibacterium sp.]
MLSLFWLLIETLGSLLVSACLLRVLASYVGLGRRDPVGQFLFAATEWLVAPLRKIVPENRASDLPALVAAILVCELMALVWALLVGGASISALLLTALYWLTKWSLYLLIGIVILQAVLSWVNPNAPVAPALDLLSRPFLAPLRRIIPLLGGVDLSPLAVIIVAQLLLNALGYLMFPLIGVR